MEIKKRIVVATPLYPPEQGGPATYARMLEEELPPRGYTVTTIPFSGVRHLPKIIRHLVYGYRLYRQAKQADLLYTLDPVSVGLPTYIASKLSRVPYVLRVPGDYAWEQGQVRFGVTDTLDVFIERPRKYGLAVRMLFWLQSSVAKQAATVVVPSQYMKEVVMKWGVHPAHIVPIYSALHPLPVSHDRAEVRRRLGFAGTVLLSVARLVPWKGMDTLIALLPRLREQIPDAHLVIVGDGPELPKLKQLVVEKGVSQYVEFYPPMKRSDLGDMKLAADVFVLNTGYEGLSHDLLEVMDVGTPIVTTNVGGNPELIKDGTTGLLVAYNDTDALVAAIVRAATHTTLATTMVQHARLRVRDFAQATVVAELETVLTDIP